MSVEETQQTMQRYLDALLARGDFASCFADDVEWTTMETGDHVRGRDAVRDYIVAMHTQLFDAVPELRSVATSDGFAALEAVFVGTQIAEFGGVPATGASIRVPYAMAYDLVDDKITALRAYLPLHAMVEQLRAAAPAAAPA